MPVRSWTACAVLAITLSVPLGAHDAHVVGPYRLVIGWGEEPAYTGSRNSVVVEVSEVGKGPLTDLGGGALSAEVFFGSERIILPLQPTGKDFRAWIVPTRAGTYTFHVTGRIKDRTIDLTSTCSEKTFDCVVNASEIQFPIKDPSAGQLAERVERSLPRADRALESARQARMIAFSAAGVAMLALISAIGLGLRRGRKGG